MILGLWIHTQINWRSRIYNHGTLRIDFGPGSGVRWYLVPGPLVTRIMMMMKTVLEVIKLGRVRLRKDRRTGYFVTSLDAYRNLIGLLVDFLA